MIKLDCFRHTEAIIRPFRVTVDALNWHHTVNALDRGDGHFDAAPLAQVVVADLDAARGAALL